MNRRFHIRVLLTLLLSLSASTAYPAQGNGDGSGIGGTGVKSGDGGIGGTGVVEQAQPEMLPERAELPERIERPEVERPGFEVLERPEIGMDLPSNDRPETPKP